MKSVTHSQHSEKTVYFKHFLIKKISWLFSSLYLMSICDCTSKLWWLNLGWVHCWVCQERCGSCDARIPVYLWFRNWFILWLHLWPVLWCCKYSHSDFCEDGEITGSVLEVTYSHPALIQLYYWTGLWPKQTRNKQKTETKIETITDGRQSHVHRGP